MCNDDGHLVDDDEGQLVDDDGGQVDDDDGQLASVALPTIDPRLTHYLTRGVSWYLAML